MVWNWQYFLNEKQVSVIEWGGILKGLVKDGSRDHTYACLTRMQMGKLEINICFFICKRRLGTFPMCQAEEEGQKDDKDSGSWVAHRLPDEAQRSTNYWTVLLTAKYVMGNCGTLEAELPEGTEIQEFVWDKRGSRQHEADTGTTGMKGEEQWALGSRSSYWMREKKLSKWIKEKRRDEEVGGPGIDRQRSKTYPEERIGKMKTDTSIK